tara:strand:- start:7170 stop:9047 length:1878 start_codon:yes stop_codon:yes gene_type:complete
MDFVIPSSFGGIDMDRSYLQILSTITTTDKGTTTGVHNFNTSWNGTLQGALYNSALIRNTRLSSSKKGQLEDIRRSDLLHQILQHYSMNTADQQGCQYKDLSQIADPHTQVNSLYRNLVGRGSIKSTEVEAPVRIEMRDLLGLGRSQLNLNALGNLHLHLEGNFLDVVTLHEVANGVKVDDIASLNIPVLDSLNPFEALYYKVNVAVTANQTVLTIPTTFGTIPEANAFVNKSNAPYWVGQKLGFFVADTTDNGKLTPAVITQIDFVQSAPEGNASTCRGWQIQLTFGGTGIANAAFASGAQDVYIFPIQAESATWNIGRAELVLCVIPNAPKSSGIQYKSYNTIEDFAPETTSFQRQYQLPANAVANLICFDTNPSNHNSYDSTITSYTLRSDNVDLVNRPIAIHSANHAAGRPRDPLHAIMLEKTLARMGVPFKNYTEVYPSAMKANTHLLKTSTVATTLELGALVGIANSGFTNVGGTFTDLPTSTTDATAKGAGALMRVIIGAGADFANITAMSFVDGGNGLYKPGDVVQLDGDSGTLTGGGDLQVTLKSFHFDGGLPFIQNTLPSVGGTTDTDNGQGVLVLPAPLPLTAQPKLFQINIEKSSATDMNLVQFQQMIRQVKF